MSQSTVYVRLPDLTAGACRPPAAAEVFRDINTTTTPQAVEICQRCPAATLAACLEWAVVHEDSGVWAGLTKYGLRNERMRRGIRLDEVHLGEIAPRPKMQRRAAAS